MRVLIAAVLALVWVASPGSADAPPPQQRARSPQQIAAVTVDQLDGAFNFAPDVHLQVNNVETATIEAGEVAHTCAAPAASTGSHSVWFATFLENGKLSLDTAGSQYQTGSGPIDNTVISLYRYSGHLTAGAMSSLIPVACNSGGTGAGKIKNLKVKRGTYVVQVSLESGAAATAGSTVSLLAKYKPAKRINGDRPNDARPITFPASKMFGSLGVATADLNEPTDPNFTDVYLPTRSLWYSFSLRAPNTLALIPSGMIVISLFKRQPNGTLEPQLANQISSLFMYQLSKGDYLIRVAMRHTPLHFSYLETFSVQSSQMYALPNIGPANYAFSTNEGTPAAASSMVGWKVKNATPSGSPNADEPFCIAMTYTCGYRIVSSGADEATELSGTAKLTNLRLKKHEIIAIGIGGASSGNSAVRVRVVLTDADGNKITLRRDVPATPVMGTYTFATMPRSFKPVKAKVFLTYLSRTAGDMVNIDTVYILPYRLADPDRTAAASPLPAPPIPAPR